MRLQVLLPAVRCLSQSTDFLFFVFFYGHFSTKKRKETKMRISKTPKNNKIRFLAPKNKKETKFGRPLLSANCPPSVQRYIPQCLHFRVFLSLISFLQDHNIIISAYSKTL